MQDLESLKWGTMFGKFSSLEERHRWGLEMFFSGVDKGSIALGTMAFYKLGFLMLYSEKWARLDYMLALWCLVEIGFHVYVRNKMEELDTHRPVGVSLMGNEQRLRLARQTCEHMEDVAQDLGGWHRDAGDLHFGHVEEWLIHMFFEKPRENLNLDESVQANHIIAIFRDRMGMPKRLPREKGSLMIPGLLPVNYEIRSASFYATIWGAKLLGRLPLMFFGFRLRRMQGGLECWGYKPTKIDRTQTPILFIPGIGFGPMQYIDHFRQLQARHPNRQIFVLSTPHANLSPFAEVVTETHFLEAIDTLMTEHRFSQFSLLAHSFGTLFAAWIVCYRPKALSNLTLIDPICFMFWEATLQYNSQYAKPDSSLQYVCVRFITKDPIFSAASSRHLYWPSANLLPENIPCPASIYLSKKDWAIDSIRTNQYLNHRKAVSSLNSLNVHLLDLAHQEYMLVPDAYNHINDSI